MKAVCVLNTGRNVMKLAYGLGQFKSNMFYLARDVRRTLRDGWCGAEDLVDDFTVAVKREPLKAIGLTFGVALGMGTLTGWLATRR